jgi:hypothetical protein
MRIVSKILAASLVFLLSPACAAPASGVGDSGVPDGFGGLVFAAFDDGQAARPATVALADLRRTTSAKRGERLVLHTVITQPKADAAGFAQVRCHVKATRPDRTVSFEQRDIACLQGKLPGGNSQAFLSSMVVRFKADATDPPGRWLFEVELHDLNGNTRRRLQTYFEVQGEAGLVSWRD